MIIKCERDGEDIIIYDRGFWRDPLRQGFPHTREFSLYRDKIQKTKILKNDTIRFLKLLYVGGRALSKPI